jgi:hypothetical protein
MPSISALILSHLESVASERARRLSTPGLAAKVALLKEYQQRRFSHTYADLLVSPRYGPAARFFLDELYGPTDFSRRDAQFARVIPALVRLFPAEVVDTVAALSELHALSEALDSSMGTELSGDRLTAVEYVRAWQRTGCVDERNAQIALTITVAKKLDGFTRNLLLRNGLRLMRSPASAAGLSELQQLLEAGFDTFRAMKGAREFIAILSDREHSLGSALFGASEGAAVIDDKSLSDACALLPPDNEQRS